MTLKVIGTGFGRTGTDSMREALNILGVGPCHHMHEIIENDDLQAIWRRVGLGDKPDWQKLITAYPDAKVILTWRSAESWWESFAKTILPILENTEDMESLGATVVAGISFAGKPITRDHAIATYEANVAAVKAIVSPDRLLVFKIGDGWEPLCAHLNLPVPDVPFPRRNNTEEFKAKNAADMTK